MAPKNASTYASEFDERVERLNLLAMHAGSAAKTAEMSAITIAKQSKVLDQHVASSSA